MMKNIKVGQKLTLHYGDELGALSKALDSMSIRFQSIFKNIRHKSVVQ